MEEFVFEKKQQFSMFCHLFHYFTGDIISICVRIVWSRNAAMNYPVLRINFTVRNIKSTIRRYM